MFFLFIESKSKNLQKIRLHKSSSILIRTNQTPQTQHHRYQQHTHPHELESHATRMRNSASYVAPSSSHEQRHKETACEPADDRHTPKDQASLPLVHTAKAPPQYQSCAVEDDMEANAETCDAPSL